MIIFQIAKNIFFLLLLLFILLISFVCYHVIFDKPTNAFYDYKEIYPELLRIHAHQPIITKEVNQVVLNEWIDWPETYLYDNNKLPETWKIIPLYGFGIWCDEHCEKMPTLTKFLKDLPGLRIAILSKLKPNTKLKPHEGWYVHSNNVLRCHYGLQLPVNKQSYIGIKNCYFGVNDAIEYHKLHDWIVFDDSKIHYAVNDSEEERIVIIIDLERPPSVPKGTSSVKSSDELLELVNEFKRRNLHTTQEVSKEYIDLFNAK